jgi:hypothetical protein
LIDVEPVLLWGGCALAVCAQHNHSLRALALGDNQIGAAGAQALAHALKARVSEWVSGWKQAVGESVLERADKEVWCVDALWGGVFVRCSITTRFRPCTSATIRSVQTAVKR